MNNENLISKFTNDELIKELLNRKEIRYISYGCNDMVTMDIPGSGTVFVLHKSIESDDGKKYKMREVTWDE